MLRRTSPGPLLSVPANPTHHATVEMVRVVPGSTPVAAAGPAVVVQRRPGVHAVDGSPKAREDGRDSGAPYKSRFSAPGEVYQGVMPGHPRYCADVHCTESANTVLDRFCLVRYWLILDISCSAAQVVRLLANLGADAIVFNLPEHW
jgi:hypothetical protein